MLSYILKEKTLVCSWERIVRDARARGKNSVSWIADGAVFYDTDRTEELIEHELSTN